MNYDFFEIYILITDITSFRIIYILRFLNYIQVEI